MDRTSFDGFEFSTTERTSTPRLRLRHVAALGVAVGISAALGVAAVALGVAERMRGQRRSVVAPVIVEAPREASPRPMAA